MARRSTRAKKKSVKIDFSDVGKQFEAGMEYAVEVKACTLEEGNEYPYFAFQFKGMDEDYENSIMYHNASTSPQSLWRLRPLLEALGIDVPDGPLDIDPDELVGLQCMCSTISEKKPGGGSSIKPDEFWPLDEGSTSGGGKSGGDDEVDLDELDDADIKKLAKEFGIKGRNVDTLREELAEADPAELAEACEDLGIEIGEPEEPEPKSRRGRKAKEEDDEPEKPARSRRGKTKAEEEEDEAPKGRGRSSRGSGRSKDSRKSKASVTEDEVQDMSEEELEDLIEQYDLDVDLDEHKTLRKKKVAVIDALQEAGVIEE